MHNIASGTNGSLADDHDNDCDPTFLATFDMVEDMKAFMGNNGMLEPRITFFENFSFIYSFFII